MEAPTPWRRLSYKALKNISLEGRVADLGGSRKSGYHELFSGSKDITVVNFDKEYGYDLCFDLEKQFPIDSNSFQTVLCINTLEHVYNFKQVLQESHRILTDKGKIVLAVPFLMYVHPCPNDYFRYSAQALQTLLTETGFTSIEIKTIGRGPILAATQMLYSVFRFPIFRNIAYFFALALDAFVCRVMKGATVRYPLGYVVTAQK